MYSKTVLLIINFIALISSEFTFEDLNEFPDYGYKSFQRTKNLRQNFIKNRKRNDVTAKRIKLLNKYLPNNTVYIDEIAHFEISKNHSEFENVNEVEKEFRNLIAMRGLKYTYKRDTYWRTWRIVRYPRKEIIVNYRCENSVNNTNFHSCGYWVIEDKSPPCPYELFSISKLNKICAVHLNKYYDVKKSCSSLINLSDLTGACDNPAVTEWNIEKTFNAKVSERFPSVICGGGGRQSCTISTLYKIAEDYISFSIVNATYDVIYSRIMKKGKNYACIKECGKMNPYSKLITTKEKSLRINLLGSKNKREDMGRRNKHFSYPSKLQTNLHRSYYIDRSKVKNNIFEDKITTKAPTCKALKLSLVQDELDEDYN